MNLNSQKEIALENANRAYEWAIVNGDENPDLIAEAVYRRTMEENNDL